MKKLRTSVSLIKIIQFTHSSFIVSSISIFLTPLPEWPYPVWQTWIFPWGTSLQSHFSRRITWDPRWLNIRHRRDQILNQTTITWGKSIIAFYMSVNRLILIQDRRYHTSHFIRMRSWSMLWKYDDVNEMTKSGNINCFEHSHISSWDTWILRYESGTWKGTVFISFNR